MDLLDRYLRQVRSALPATERDDITRELGENLRAMLDDRADAMGRPLTTDEQREVLAGFGHPLAVASRFRVDQPSVAFGRRLIGPIVWPVYIRVLLIAVGLSAAGATVSLLLDQDAWSLGVAVSRVAGPVALAFLIVTGVFAVIERTATSAWTGWDAEQELPLPGLGPGTETGSTTLPPAWKVRLGMTGELVAALLGLAVWIWFAPSTFDGGWIVPGPGWTEPYPWLAVPIALTIGASLTAIVAPARRVVAGTLSVAADAVLLGLVLWSLALGDWASPAPSASPKEIDAVSTAESIAAVSLAVSAVVIALSLGSGVLNLWRAVRAGRASRAAGDRAAG
jgi:hypothetical protein